MYDGDGKFVSDFDIFVRGEWLTTFYHVTYGRVLDLVSAFFGNDDDVEIRIKRD